MKKKFAALILATVLTIGLFTGCSGNSTGSKASTASAGTSSASTDDALSKIKQKGTLVVGINADYAPYGFHAIIDGKDTISGIDVEVAKAVAKDMGVKLSLLESDFDTLLSELQAGQCDVVISCLSPTEKRKEKIDFSNNYSDDKCVALIRKEDASQYNKFDDLKSKKIGCAYGTIQESLVKKQLPKANVQYREGMAELFLELKAKQVDAVVSTESVCKISIAKNPGFAIAKGSTFDASLLGLSEGESAAVGIRKNSKSVVESVNATIEKLRKAGQLDVIMDNACKLAAKSGKGVE